jgi:pyridoxal 5'-phosphate synthase pdxT subunit
MLTILNNKKPDIIGVLDLQGGVHEHLDHLQRLGIKTRRVKQETDFADLAGCIIPGGESSCISRLIDIFDIKPSLLKAAERGMKIWGTCAGAILLATKIIGETACLGLIDIEIERNSFGSQLDSFQTEALIPAIAAESIPLTFIRAPKILKTGPKVNVLLRIDDYIAAAENENILVTVFHPELTGSIALHRYFAVKCGLIPTDSKRTYSDPQWQNSSWTQLARIV